MKTVYVDAWPTSISGDFGLTVHPTPEQCRAAGYELRTDEMRLADRLAAEEAARNAPFEISKMKLVEAFDALGKRAEFLAFVAADAEMKLYWDTATVLDSDHPKVAAAAQAISQAFGLSAEQVDALLRSARSGA